MENKETKVKDRENNLNRRNKSTDNIVITTLDSRRVVNVTKGGRRFKIGCIVLIKNETTGAVGMAYCKSNDEAGARRKAITKAIKNSSVFFPKGTRTIPRYISSKFEATKIIMKPAPSGTGIKAGSILRKILKFLEIKDISAKIINSRNLLNVSKCFFNSLHELKRKSLLNFNLNKKEKGEK
jgi:small subunit ribosomal protein S5